jgi:flagellar motor switch/type III secretory pathway protein FliN
LAEIAAALSRCLDRTFTASVGSPLPAQAEALSQLPAGPGLIVSLGVGSQAALVLLPELTGLLPAWYAQPDATGQSKLTTLAQELSLLVLPESMISEQFEARRVSSLAAAVQAGQVAADATLVPLLLSAGGSHGQALVVWPVAAPTAVLGAPPAKPAEFAAAATGQARNKSTAPPVAPSTATHLPRKLPPYAQSILRIRVPLSVTLGTTRQSVQNIVQLGPGMIIQFQKACDELLDVCVGEHRVAVGEAVKVGDKFGIRIIGLTPADERFAGIKSGRKGRRG